MKKYLLLVLLVAGCGEIETNKYYEEREAAQKSKTADIRLGFGFRKGMTREAAEAKVDSLRGTIGMALTLPSGSVLTSDLIEPKFAHNTLAEVTVRFLHASRPDFEELKSMLKQRYSQEGFSHGDSISWFYGPVEVELSSLSAADDYLVFINYRDLRLYDAYLKEFGEKLDEDQCEKKKQQEAEVKKL